MPTKVLVIEDHYDNRQILKKQLELLGYEVVQAGGGQEGLDVAVKERPDLVVLDIMMPTVDGCEVARRLRADLKTQDTPILASTVLFQDEDIQNCLRAGCNEVLTKPITLRDLKDRLEKLMPVGRRKE